MEHSLLSTFLNEIYDKKCGFTVREPEVTDIQDAVIEMLQRIFEKMAERDIRFAMSQCLPTGGFYEETKIENPDEFDFMILCHVLSQPSELSYEPGCTGCVKLIPNKKENWSDFCQNGYLRFAGENIDVDEDEITTVLRHLSVNGAIDYDISNCIDEIEREVVKPTGKLIMAGYGHFNFGFVWQSFSRDNLDNNPDFERINVDIMPSIECPQECVTVSNKLFPQHLFADAVENGVYIVPKKCQVITSHACCQLSFSRVELSMVRNMGEHHRKCYKILKYISTVVACLFIDSYALKTAMLYHHYNEKCNESTDVRHCITTVLNYLKTCSENSFLPALFVPEKNIWGYSDVPGDGKSASKRYKHQADLIFLILEIFNHIASVEESFYNFEENLGIFETFAAYLSKYSYGKLKIRDVLQRTRRVMSKREKRLASSATKKNKKRKTGEQHARRFLCIII